MARHVNDNVRIVIMPTLTKATYAAPESRQVEKLITGELLLATSEPYLKVHAVPKLRRDGSPQSIVAYMLRAYTYTADVVRLNIDNEGKVKSIETSYLADEEEARDSLPEEAQAAIRPAGRRLGPQMVFGTPVPELVTAKKAVEYAYNVATAAGFSCKKLLGAAASVANYKKYLTANCLAFGNVGHGYTGGIVLADGNLTSSWIASQAAKALWPEVVYFNSCQVFNPPFQPAIMGAGARTFVGGIINLLIGPSEEVFKCFWTGVLQTTAAMGATLQKCEKAHYPVPNAHGISGDLKKFETKVHLKAASSSPYLTTKASHARPISSGTP